MQKLVVGFLFTGFFTLSILASTKTAGIGKYRTCVPQQYDPDDSIVETCNNLDENSCNNIGICIMDVNRGILFGIYLSWCATIFMFIGIVKTIVLPLFKTKITPISTNTPTTAAISPMEYDAL